MSKQNPASQVAEVTIESIAAGGDGVARHAGIVVFVPRTAPGDRARVRMDTRKRFARGAVEAILAPSPERAEPPCAHYVKDKCGGCQLQHLNYDAQLVAKQGMIRDAIRRIGRRDVDLPAIVPSEAPWRYRRKLTLAMRRTRSRGWVIGLHAVDDPSHVFQLEDCPITDERVLAAWRQVMAAHQYFPPADDLRAFVQLTEQGAAVVLEGGHAWPERGAFFERVPLATSLWWRPVHRARTLVAERRATLAHASADASFQQVNATVGRELHEYVLNRARAHAPATVVDAYAGSGATAIPLAVDGARVTAIEVDPDAVERCAAGLPAGSRAIAARVEDVMATSLPADVVLVNPPRTGMHERVTQAIEASHPLPRAVIYTSCDPATLARDLTRMPRYSLASIKAFDMFPQTAHVETVCELVLTDTTQEHAA